MGLPCISDYRRGDELHPMSPWAEDAEDAEDIGDLLVTPDSITDALGLMTQGEDAYRPQSLLTMDDTVGDASTERLLATLFVTDDKAVAMRALIELRQRVEATIEARAKVTA